MDSLVTDKEIPRYVYICGITGIVFLSLAFIFYLVLYFVYDTKIDIAVQNSVKRSGGFYAVSILTIVFSILGLLLSFFIIYGHIIKQKKDPQVLFGHHSYIEFPDEGKFIEIERETSQVYSGGRKEEPTKTTDRLNTDFL